MFSLISSPSTFLDSTEIILKSSSRSVRTNQQPNLPFALPAYPVTIAIDFFPSTLAADRLPVLVAAE